MLTNKAVKSLFSFTIQMLCMVVVNESEVIYATILYNESELFNNHANNNSIHCL